MAPVCAVRVGWSLAKRAAEISSLLVAGGGGEISANAPGLRDFGVTEPGVPVLHVGEALLLGPVERARILR